MRRTSTQEFIYKWRTRGRTITFSWIGEAEVALARVYALAFTGDNKMLLVGDDAPGDSEHWLPGGGIEAGETPERALARELIEEAGAAILDLERIGIQRVDKPGEDSEYHAFYWCRISLSNTFVPKHEITHRYLVPPEEFLDTLFWGRDDPKAAMLLERSLEIERRLSGSEGKLPE